VIFRPDAARPFSSSTLAWKMGERRYNQNISPSAATTSSAPSRRLTVPSFQSTNAKRPTLSTMATGPSRGMRTSIGATSKASPRAAVRRKIVEPITVPSAIWGRPPRAAAAPLARFSGSKPDTTTPTKKVLIAKRAATWIAPSVNNSAPHTTRARPAMRARRPISMRSALLTPRIAREGGLPRCLLYLWRHRATSVPWACR
jgi:hypothetical protein